MKLALATLLLASVAHLPCAAARIGPKAFRQSSEKPMDPHKAHLAPVPTRQDTTEHRIIGGEAAEQGEFPFYVKWLGENGFCGGSLIHEDIILTAAHCDVVIADSVSIGAYFLESADANAETRQIETRMIHPEYNEQDTYVNDVMVLKITSPSSLTPIALNDDTSSPSGGEDVTVIGLGVTDVVLETVANALQKASLQIIAHDQCAADYDVLVPDATINEDVMLCAGVEEDNKAACNGDSGGPLLQLHNGEYVQVGITSWGIEGCVGFESPGVYTRVSGVKSWIDQMICELSQNPPASCGSTPTPPSTPKPSEGEQCEDVPGWYDSDGPEYDCAWYEENDACDFAQEYENDGYTAMEACCFCAGNDSTPTPPSTPEPSEGEQCEDVAGWYDSEGPKYDCAWYEENDACDFAQGFENDGYTAMEACCFCGGNESTPTPSSTPEPGEGEQCKDVAGWYDSDGPEYDCAWYEENDACDFASEYENDGYTATEACCFCGGGNL